MIISERIFQILGERAMSQKEFSRRTGISQSTISDWKRKKTNPAADKIMVICDTLQVSPYELLSGADSRFEEQLDYVIVPKGSEEFLLLEQYHTLRRRSKERFMGYLRALSEEE